ncbi:MAG: histidine phosphatase family protein [Bacteroidales bacterium]|nr:histidine phosphatase family protein [Bacteroidales bacterium]
MKNLYLMRHAKSDWTNDIVDDSDRVLNYIGHKQARIVAEEINKKNIKFDTIICSPVKRAQQTAEIIKNNTNFEKEIIEKQCFYFSNIKEVIQVIKNLDDNISTPLLIGHNPIWSKLVNLLSKSNIYLDTANLVALTTNANSWKDADTFQLDFIIKPQNLM